MDSISKDILIYLMKLMPPRDILALGAACRRFHGLSKDELLWRFLVRRDFGVEPIYGDSALEIYKEEYTNVYYGATDTPYLDLLYVACQYGQLGGARCALRHGADPRLNFDETFYRAVVNGYLDIVRLLLEDGRVDPTIDDNWTIVDAVDGGDIDMVRLLLSDPRVDVNVRNGELLECAIFNGSNEMALVILCDSRFDPTANRFCTIRKGKNGAIESLELYVPDWERTLTMHFSNH